MFLRRTIFGQTICCFVSVLSLLSQLPAGEKDVRFQQDILPLLTGRCFHCHGPDSETREAELRLDDPASALAELDSGVTAIVPGQPDQSGLIERIDSSDPDLRMPPESTGLALSAEERELLRRWIEQGAGYETHWSFVAPRRPDVPALEHDWVRGPIDQFVLRRLRQEGLSPQPPADHYRLARRVSLALTGLPPSLNSAAAFVADTRPAAYERFVDRLLDTSAYGERWARVWLDLARYADSAGYAQDPPRIIWRYRDWVIDAINANMAFDQFTVAQLAGDLLPAADDDTLIATAFHRNTMTNSEGGTDDEEFRSAAIVDRVNTTMQVWMGLTMGCAQCHDHKYDPISQAEYYQFFALLNNTEDADRGDESPTLTTFTQGQEFARERLERELAAQEEIVNQRAHPDSPERKKLAELRQKLTDIKGIPTPILRELSGEKRRQTHIHVRGNFLIKGAEVRPGTPALFPPLPTGAQPDRLALARWLVSPQNPLTARVVVNRFWEQLFGTGLVDTSEDFGRQGNLPSHPDLLDYLATELIAHQWDTKWLVRAIVTSATYRQSAEVSPELAQRDPQNRLLARGPRFRLGAEMIRDQALAVSGLLSDKMHGPSVQPPRPNLGLRAAFGGSTDWQTSAGEDRYRRGLYTSWRRTTPYPSMTTFDAPSREFCTVKRIRTNTPLQALVTLNDPVFVETAQALARRIVAEAPGQSVAERVAYGFRLCLLRAPQGAEVQRLVALYEQAYERFQQRPEQAKLLASEPLGAVPASVDVAELAGWTVVGNVLLNLDEVLAR